MERGESIVELNLQTVYQDCLPAVYRVAFSYLHDRCDSEDAAQEAFLRLARFGGRFEDRRQVKAWLIVTVSNICKDMLRRRRRQDESLDALGELAAPPADSSGLTEAIEELPGNYRTVIYLYYYEGYTVKEIAAALHRSEGTVKSWLHRARRVLRDSLEVSDDD